MSAPPLPAPPASRRRAAAWQLLFQYGGIGVSVAKNLLLVPVVLHYLDLDLYGGWLASGSAVATLAVAEAGLGLNMIQRLAAAHAQKDSEQVAQMAGTGMALLVGVALILGVLGTLLAPFIPGWLQIQPAHQAVLSSCVRLSAWGVGVNLLFVNLSGLPMAMQYARGASALRLAMQALEVALCFALLPWLKDPRVFPLALLIANGVGLLIAIGTVGFFWRAEALPAWKITRSSALVLARQSAPLLLSRSAAMLASNSESTLTAAMLNPSAAALLSINARLFSVAQQAISPIALSSFSGLAHLAGGESRERVRGVLDELLSLGAAVALVLLPVLLIVHRGFLGLWLGGQYYGGLALAFALALSVLVSSRSQQLQLATLAMGDSKGAALGNALDPVIKVGVLTLLLRPLGPIAAPLATLASSATLTFVAFPHFLARALKSSWLQTWILCVKSLASVGACLLVAALIAKVLPPAQDWLHLALEGAIVGTGFGIAALVCYPSARRLVLRYARR